jgi:hypothetical protein
LLHHFIEILRARWAATRKPEHPMMLLKRNGLARLLPAARPFNKQCGHGQLHTGHGVCT